MSSEASIKEIVEFGLDRISADQKVAVSLRDLMYVNQVVGELNRFFHQPMHLISLEAVQRFLGDVNSGGAYEAIHTAYYSKLREMLPPSIEHLVDEGAFDHPSPPSYYGDAA